MSRFDPCPLGSSGASACMWAGGVAQPVCIGATTKKGERVNKGGGGGGEEKAVLYFRLKRGAKQHQRCSICSSVH